jgi:hypothetical protein
VSNVQELEGHSSSEDLDRAGQMIDPHEAAIRREICGIRSACRGSHIPVPWHESEPVLVARLLQL